MGRATPLRPLRGRISNISIHALRGEGDRRSARVGRQCSHFNPRPPWGGRPRKSHMLCYNLNFNPRPPWGGRRKRIDNIGQMQNFNPRPPWGGRRRLEFVNLESENFNPRPPWGGRRKIIDENLIINRNFNPRPPWGGRPVDAIEKERAKAFQSTPSVGRAT